MGALFLSPQDFFTEVVDDALKERKVKTVPLAHKYLVNLLQHYISAENLEHRETLAELFLKAANSDHNQRIELLKKLGDRSLYISGFFADSLQRKVVDIDYYRDMGCSAYSTLAGTIREDSLSVVFREFSDKFIEFVEVLNIISSKAQMQSENNILRLYETYAKTGSETAREKLLEKGLIAVPLETIPLKKQ
jgi:hypothetical protein